MRSSLRPDILGPGQQPQSSVLLPPSAQGVRFSPRHLCLRGCSRLEKTQQATQTRSSAPPGLGPCFPPPRLDSSSQLPITTTFSPPQLTIGLLISWENRSSQSRTSCPWPDVYRQLTEHFSLFVGDLSLLPSQAPLLRCPDPLPPGPLSSITQAVLPSL